MYFVALSMSTLREHSSDSTPNVDLGHCTLSTGQGSIFPPESRPEPLPFVDHAGY